METLLEPLRGALKGPSKASLRDPFTGTQGLQYNTI